MIKRLIYLKRFLSAKLRGYFWLPCPICGKMFGGNEWHAVLYTSVCEGVSVCKDCTKEAEKRNVKSWEKWVREENRI